VLLVSAPSGRYRRPLHFASPESGNTEVAGGGGGQCSSEGGALREQRWTTGMILAAFDYIGTLMACLASKDSFKSPRQNP
jgi:hypothetical protein